MAWRSKALPKVYPRSTQALGLLKSMARVCLEYGWEQPRVWIRYADATSMLPKGMPAERSVLVALQRRYSVIRKIFRLII